MEYYFDRDDRLDRLKYARFLETLLLNCDRYRREDSDGAYVIALDSPWGTGKTRFVKMLRNYLEGRESKDKVDSPTKKEAKFNVIYYNAWETDFSQDALQPIIYSVVNSPELNPSKFRKAVKKEIEDFNKTASEVVKILAYSFFDRLLGSTSAGEIKEIVDRGEYEKDDPLIEYKKRLDLLEDFKTSLGKVIKATKKKLVIVIDELDRCRPTFAIETLEIVKHLFAVNDIAFIFAIDIEQLSYSVKTLYGTGMNTSGYLCRFFDSVTKMSVPNIRPFIGGLLLNLAYYKKNQSHYIINNTEYLAQLSEIFDLSLRDVTTIISTYKCMLTAFLNEYSDYREHQSYLFFLVVKYKNVELYNGFFTNSLNKTDFESESTLHIRINNIRLYQDWLSSITQREKLKNARFALYSTGGRLILGSAKISAENILSNGGIITHVTFTEEGTGQGYEIYFGLDEGESIIWGTLIYKNDLKRWEEIKDLTIKEYYFRQLEMFDFVLPADEAKA